MHMKAQKLAALSLTLCLSLYLGLKLKKNGRKTSGNMVQLSSYGHGLRYAKPGRAPPDPKLFPYYMQNAQHLWLRFAEWWPHGDGGSDAAPKPIKGVVFIVPGLGEHTGRYDAVALSLNRENYVVFSLDNQGSGGSEGLRLYVKRFSHFVDDVGEFVLFMQARYPALREAPKFLLGHSMGGLIAARLAQRDPLAFRAVVLSGPAFGLTKPVPGALRSLARFLSRWTPKLPVFKLNVNLASFHAPVAELLKQDPYYSKAYLRARFSGEMMSAQDSAAADVVVSSFPFLIVHGEDDRICSLEKAKWFYENAPSADKQLTTYPAASHEVLTEYCHDKVMADLVRYLNERAIQPA